MNSIKLYNMDVMKALKKMPDESVDMQICSPPYWGLRDYGSDVEVVWDGDKNCKHDWNEVIKPAPGGRQKKKATVGRWKDAVTMSYGLEGRPQKSNFCSKCGAWKGQLGLEPDFNLFIKHLCDVFDEVKRVLKKDGTCWINLGDTYSGGCNFAEYKGLWHGKKVSGKWKESLEEIKKAKKQIGWSQIPAKCLTCIPERFVIEMINRGWILRNCIIWFKRNHMPTSVKDRFVNSYEFLFMFCKSNQKTYKNYISKDDARWLAGFIDAEGTISIHKRINIKTNEKRKNPTYSLLLQVSNTNREVIDEIKRITNVGSIMIRDEREKGYLKQYRWVVTCKEAREVIEQCYPYFIVKREQASASLCLESKRKQAEEIFQEIKKLNQREIDKTSFTYNLQNVKPEKYYFDLDAVREPHKEVSIERAKSPVGSYQHHNLHKMELVGSKADTTGRKLVEVNPKGKNPDDVINFGKYGDKKTEQTHRQGFHRERDEKDYNHPLGKCPDDFFEITTRGYKEAHFAVFPEKLVEKPIKTTPKWICNKCGKAKERIIEQEGYRTPEEEVKLKELIKERGIPRQTAGILVRSHTTKKNLGWTDCKCEKGFHPAIIMDIFAGSGTTLKVARDLNRDAIGIEIKPEYCRLIEKRLYGGSQTLFDVFEVIK